MIGVDPSVLVDFTFVTLLAFMVGRILEMLLPVRDSVISVSRWLNNAGLAVVTYVCSHIFGTFVAVYILAGFASGSALNLSGLPVWLDLTTAFLVLELIRYGTHVAMHKIPALWHVHAVHHADSTVNVTTAFRHHPLEAILSAVPKTTPEQQKAEEIGLDSHAANEQRIGGMLIAPFVARLNSQGFED